MENSMQHNPTPIRNPFIKGMAGLKGSYFKEEKKQYVVASLVIKGKEGVYSKQHKIMEQKLRELPSTKKSHMVRMKLRKSWVTLIGRQ